MNNKIDLSIIILVYNSQDVIWNCLNSIYKYKISFPYEIIIVDNNKLKFGRFRFKKYAHVRYLTCKNRGFAAGNNFAAKKARGKYLFFLNSDTLLLKNTIDNLLKVLVKDEHTGAVAPILLDKNKIPAENQGTSVLTPTKHIFNYTFVKRLLPDNIFTRDYFTKTAKKDDLIPRDILPGTAIMIRKDLFNSIGGWDENFFIYFEENDLCLRILKKDYKNFIVRSSKLIHLFEQSTKHEKQRFEQIFKQSRFCYFKKHYGLLKALTVEFFSRFTKYNLFLFSILVLGFMLRFYKINENIVFHGELGSNYLEIKNYIASSTIPLIGPPTSHPWLSFPPLFYWLFIPLFILGKSDPKIGTYFFLLIGSLTIFINYYVNKNLTNEKIALLSSFFLAISPINLELTRESRFFSLILILFYPFLLFAERILSFTKLKDYFYLGLIFALMLNFHYTPLLLIPLIIFLIFIQRKQRIIRIKNFLAGFLLPILPLIIHSVIKKDLMIMKLLFWVPYRITGFFGILQTNNFSLNNYFISSQIITDFIGRIFITNSLLSLLISLVITFVILSKTYSFIIKRNILRRDLIFLSAFYSIILGLFFHKDLPTHYLILLIPLCLIYFSEFLNILNKNISIIVILFVIAIININYYFSTDWFYRYKSDSKRLIPQYEVQTNASRKIIEDANGKKFELNRIGYADKFEGNFAQNYQYLLWWMGNEPVKVGSKKISDPTPDLSYIIYEYLGKGEIEKGNLIFNQNGIIIIKKVLK